MYSLFAKDFTNDSNLLLNILKLAEFRILKSSLLRSIIVDGKKVLIKYFLLTLTKGTSFAFLEAYILVVLRIILRKYLGDRLLNILKKTIFYTNVILQ